MNGDCRRGLDRVSVSLVATDLWHLVGSMPNGTEAEGYLERAAKARGYTEPG